MNALLIAITLWLSANFELPMNDAVPRIERLSSAQLASLSYGALLSVSGKNGSFEEGAVPAGDVMAVYDPASKAIFLREDWTGTTPAELSILVHEVVHHGQTVAGLKYNCPQEREKLAYQAQEQWLSLFGRSLESEFGLDTFSRLAKTVCIH